jgi:hypothetical protein
MHGVSISIASTAPLDRDYLAALKARAERFQPEWISDHLCWTGVHGVNLHDLLPIPYTVEALDHVSDRIRRVQDFLGRRIAIENVSSYVTFAESEMDEWTFVRELCERADCWLLFDVNNVFVSSFNHDFDPLKFIDVVPPDRVRSISRDIRIMEPIRSTRTINPCPATSGRFTRKSAGGWGMCWP